MQTWQWSQERPSLHPLGLPTYLQGGAQCRGCPAEPREAGKALLPVAAGLHPGSCSGLSLPSSEESCRSIQDIPIPVEDDAACLAIQELPLLVEDDAACGGGGTVTTTSETKGVGRGIARAVLGRYSYSGEGVWTREPDEGSRRRPTRTASEDMSSCCMAETSAGGAGAAPSAPSAGQAEGTPREGARPAAAPSTGCAASGCGGDCHEEAAEACVARSACAGRPVDTGRPPSWAVTCKPRSQANLRCLRACNSPGPHRWQKRHRSPSRQPTAL